MENMPSNTIITTTYFSVVCVFFFFSSLNIICDSLVKLFMHTSFITPHELDINPRSAEKMISVEHLYFDG